MRVYSPPACTSIALGNDGSPLKAQCQKSINSRPEAQAIGESRRRGGTSEAQYPGDGKKKLKNRKKKEDETKTNNHQLQSAELDWWGRNPTSYLLEIPQAADRQAIDREAPINSKMQGLSAFSGPTKRQERDPTKGGEGLCPCSPPKWSLLSFLELSKLSLTLAPNFFIWASLALSQTLPNFVFSKQHDCRRFDLDQ
jgi:hypothetical protein